MRNYIVSLVDPHDSCQADPDFSGRATSTWPANHAKHFNASGLSVTTPNPFSLDKATKKLKGFSSRYAVHAHNARHLSDAPAESPILLRALPPHWIWIMQGCRVLAPKHPLSSHPALTRPESRSLRFITGTSYHRYRGYASTRQSTQYNIYPPIA